MSDSSACIFCKIVRGEFAAVQVYEDDQTISFMDVRPASPGHTLVVSKTHAANLLEIAERDLLAVTATVQRVARAVQHVLNPDGMRISQFNGAAAGQTVLHYHVHIVPMQAGVKAGAHGRELADPEQLKALGAKISAALAR